MLILWSLFLSLFRLNVYELQIRVRLGAENGWLDPGTVLVDTEMYFNDVQYLPYYCTCGSCNAVNSSVFLQITNIANTYLLLMHCVDGSVVAILLFSVRL